jgi:hypothetical protein
MLRGSRWLRRADTIYYPHVWIPRNHNRHSPPKKVADPANHHQDPAMRHQSAGGYGAGVKNKLDLTNEGVAWWWAGFQQRYPRPLGRLSGTRLSWSFGLLLTAMECWEVDGG